MKRLAGILLIFIYLFSFAELHNLLRIPILFTHYIEHRQQDHGISFWSFIRVHYVNPYDEDDDYKRDRQLPFRDTDCCISTVTSVLECNQIVIGVDKPVEVLREFHLFDEMNKPQFVSSDIFQPPRSA